MFKPSPKQMVEQKARYLYGRDKKLKVTGIRLSPADAKLAGLTMGIEGTYSTECYIDGVLVAAAHDRDWRTAYRKLKIAMELAHQKSIDVSAKAT